MALLDRLLGDVVPDVPLVNDPIRKGIAADHFLPMIYFWKVKADPDINRANVINRLGLTADDEAGLDALAAKFDALVTESLKRLYFEDLRNALLLAQARDHQKINRAKFKQLLGMT